jgi:hypothetical protein
MIYVTPGDGWEYVEGSLPMQDHSWAGKSFKSAKITFGKTTDEVMPEFVVLKDSAGADKAKAVTITVVTIESELPKNSEYTIVMKKFPEWTFTMEQQSDVSSYVIAEE